MRRRLVLVRARDEERRELGGKVPGEDAITRKQRQDKGRSTARATRNRAVKKKEDTNSVERDDSRVTERATEKKGDRLRKTAGRPENMQPHKITPDISRGTHCCGGGVSASSPTPSDYFTLLYFTLLNGDLGSQLRQSRKSI